MCNAYIYWILDALYYSLGGLVWGSDEIFALLIDWQLSHGWQLTRQTQEGCAVDSQSQPRHSRHSLNRVIEVTSWSQGDKRTRATTNIQSKIFWPFDEFFSRFFFAENAENEKMQANHEALGRRKIERGSLWTCRVHTRQFHRDYPIFLPYPRAILWRLSHSYTSTFLQANSKQAQKPRDCLIRIDKKGHKAVK